MSEKQGLIDKFSFWAIGSFIDMMDNEMEAWTLQGPLKEVLQASGIKNWGLLRDASISWMMTKYEFGIIEIDKRRNPIIYNQILPLW